MSGEPASKLKALARNAGIGFLKLVGAASGLVLLLVITFVALRVPPKDGLLALWTGAFGDSQSGHFYPISESLVKMTPLLLAGLGVTIAWRGGMFSVGAEGQIVVGALGAMFVGLKLSALPGGVLTLSMLIASCLSGAAWGWIAGWLRVKRGVQEVVSTIMLNYVAIYFLGAMVEGPMQEKAKRLSQTDALPDSALLAHVIPARLSGDIQTRLHTGTVLAVLVSVAIYIYLAYTKGGFQLKVVGQNPDAARAARYPVDQIRLRAMWLSGAICGLAGGIELLGISGRLYSSFPAGWGYTAIPVALLGGLSAIGTLISAIFFGALTAGCGNLARFSNVSSTLVNVIQAVAALTVVGGRAWKNRKAGDEAN